MKFSITIEIPKPEKKPGKNKENAQKIKKVLAKELKQAADGALSLAGAGIDAAKKFFPAFERLIDSISDEIKTDIAAVRDRDPAARNDIEVLVLYSGVHAILAYRVAHKLYLGKKYFPARAISQLAKFFTGIEIHPGAKIGRGLVIDHGAGVVIGETAEYCNYF